ncbi:hypothetical protein AB0H12_20755 [Actinosynnema sp. NPDC023794]
MGRTTIRTTLVFAALVASATACGGGGSTGGATSATTPVPVSLTVPGRPSDQVTDVAAVGLSREQLAEIERACEQVEGIPGISDKCIDSIADVAVLPTATTTPGASPPSRPPCHEPPCVLFGLARDDADVGVVMIWDPDPGSTFCRRRAELCSGATVAARSIVAPTSTTTPPTTSTRTTGRPPTTGTGTGTPPSWPTPTPPPRTTGS